MSIEFDSTLTPKEAVERLKTVNLDGPFFRLIPSRFPPVSLYQRIADQSKWDQIVEIENTTNPRLRSREKLGVSLHFSDPASPLLQNWNHAPFTYPNPEGSTFFGPVTQCLELGDCLQTALSYAITGRETFLSRTSEGPTGLDMRVLKHPVKGTFVDACSLPQGMGEESRWAIGEAILKDGFDGIIFNLACRPFGRFVGVLNPETLGKAEQAEHFRFVWDGTAISQVYSFTDGKVWTPEQISGSKNLLAA